MSAPKNGFLCLSSSLAAQARGRSPFGKAPSPDSESGALVQAIIDELSRDWDTPKSLRVTKYQRMARAFAIYASEVLDDGVRTTLIENNFGLLDNIEAGARQLKLVHTLRLVDYVRSVVPRSIVNEPAYVTRAEYCQDPEVLDALDALDSLQWPEKARREIILAAVNLVLQHPKEFLPC